jgi:transcriptional regulator with XRE-family HTH domain
MSGAGVYNQRRSATAHPLELEGSAEKTESESIATPNMNLGTRVSVVKHVKYRYSELYKNTEVDVSTSLGDKIRELRKKKGYTLEKLAELTESSKSYIWELENKNPPRPSADKVARIASVLGVTSDYLLDRTQKTNVAEATDQAFFRRYRKMEPATKEKIRRMVDLWEDDK